MARLAIHEAAAWALFVVAAAALEEALVSVLVLARQAYARPFSARAWALSVVTWSAPSVALAALQQAARVAQAVAVARRTTQLTEAAR